MKTYLVDSFTSVPFRGNPAGVCLVDDTISERLMQSIASELNLSETAFVSRLVQGSYSIRYFSPKMEIPLCGHATLAASEVLFSNGSELKSADRILFKTQSGLELPILKCDHQIVMEFPVYKLEPAEAPEAMLNALGIEAVNECRFNRENRILMLEISDAGKLAELKPDFHKLVASHSAINGVSVTAKSNDQEFDFHSRYFWPWSGSDEDPVTGGTHTFLAKYWSDKLGKRSMRSFQASARTGSLDVELLDQDRLLIKGQAVVVLAGQWMAGEA
ncbi:MAG: PhzF family phenazine biosynthesis protein [Mariniblastus sp.]|jgi:PhzF family phenazine biosynthesis protein